MARLRLPPSVVLIGFGALLSIVLVTSTAIAWQTATQPQPTSCGCNLWTWTPATGTIWPAATLFTIILLCSVRLGRSAWRIFRREQAIRRMVQQGQSRQLVHHHLAIRYLLVETAEPFALTIGYVRPTIIISRGLLLRLNGSEFRAVLRHEYAHQRGYHPLWRWFVGLIGETFSFVPWVKDLHQAAIAEFEIIADRAASDGYRDTVTVARALLRVEGLHPSVGIAWSAVEARVDHLLDPHLRPEAPIVLRGLWFALVALAMATTVGVAAIKVAQADSKVPPICRETRVLCAERHDRWTPIQTMSMYETR